MATSTFARNIQAEGWRYDPAARGVGGWLRPDTTWDPRTNSLNTNNSVGGTVFVPQTAGASSGISSVAFSPTLPAMGAPGTVGFSPVSVSGTVRANPIRASMASWAAPGVDAAMRDVGNVRAGRVDPFLVDDPAILQELDRQAQEELALGGYLSPEEERQAQQAAREAFAARGLATGDAAALAEVMNRDRFATERQAGRRQFAAGVSGMLSNLDLANQGAYNQVELANADAALRAGLANQGTRLATWQTGQEGGLRVALSNQEAANQVALANETNRLQASQFNVDAGLRAALANQSAGLQAGQFNASNALDYARLGLEGSLGAFNAGTNRLNALSNMQSATSSQGNYAGIPKEMLMNRWEGNQIQQGTNAGQLLANRQAGNQAGNQMQVVANAPRQAANPRYRPLGTTSWYGGYRNI